MRDAPGRRARPLRRSACSRCSGTGCRRARCGCRRASAAALRSSSDTAASTMPGVQMPHCAPPCSMNASCTAWSRSPCGHAFDRRDRRAVGVQQRHEAAVHELAVERTEQAPHSPSPQPSFVPVSRSCSAARRAAAPSDARAASTGGAVDAARRPRPTGVSAHAPSPSSPSTTPASSGSRADRRRWRARRR